MSTTILIVEDDPAIQELLSVTLRHTGYLSFGAPSAEDAQVVLEYELPDLILLDWMLPGQSGLDFAKKLRNDNKTRNLPIIMLSARALEEDKTLCFGAGVDDYVTKPFSPKELIARIRSVLTDRLPHLAKGQVIRGTLTLDLSTNQISAQEKPLRLSPIEFRLLSFFMTHPEQVYTRHQIQEHIWGNSSFIEERTIDVHVKRLREALEPSSNHSRIETIRGIGYRFNDLT
ncbi:winged helix-turn-helix domain-containing protein [Propionivibrio dicarboxylicus]|uniref:Two-component system, OmpR family, phosphate regulon response regulator PhoB n=1 Tax=Propionivibrio dicarboxylicus TaxID=83767 RepID=A0A1G8ERV8_9RHOO|nr:winged helix-turn-helix domain-containing protein [Propionivibrio dicarboxylicus]SDH72613.1 two-component system, OmpR family, phosphate regulon response regulator PhoB [Propionivibrio dicarboxylicus]